VRETLPSRRTETAAHQGLVDEVFGATATSDLVLSPWDLGDPEHDASDAAPQRGGGVKLRGIVPLSAGIRSRLAPEPARFHREASMAIVIRLGRGRVSPVHNSSTGFLQSG